MENTKLQLQNEQNVEKMDFIDDKQGIYENDINPPVSDCAKNPACYGVYEDQNKRARTYFIISLIGMLLSVLVFPGIILSAIGYIGSLTGLRRFSDKAYVRGIWTGALGMGLNLFMLFGFIIFAIS